MTRLYLIRHGETNCNKMRITQGSSNTCLSSTGVEQAKKLAERMSKENIDLIYSSDLCRAYNTARCIAEIFNLPVYRLKELREIHYGEWEGMSKDYIKKEYADVYKKWMEEPHLAAIPGEKSLLNVQDRVVKVINHIVAKHLNKNIAVITHNGVIKTGIISFVNMDLRMYNRIQQGNTAVNILDFHDNNVVLKLYNDTSHLNSRGGLDEEIKNTKKNEEKEN